MSNLAEYQLKKKIQEKSSKFQITILEMAISHEKFEDTKGVFRSSKFKKDKK
jgi:hypothetical protein